MHLCDSKYSYIDAIATKFRYLGYITRIRNLRDDSDKTQQEIADYLGTSQTMYARYERGANEMPIRHLIKLAQFYLI